MGTGGFGYQFAAEGSGRTFKLNWVVTSQLATVRRNGSIKRVIHRKRKAYGTISDIRDVRVWFHLPRRSNSSFYLITVQFRRTGNILGSYGQYLRVVEPTTSFRLKTDRNVVKVGAPLSFRLENFGTRALSSGKAYVVEHYTAQKAGRWLLVFPTGRGGRSE